MFPHCSNWQQAIIRSDNDLVPNRGKTIIWTNNGLLKWRIYIRGVYSRTSDSLLKIQNLTERAKIAVAQS